MPGGNALLSGCRGGILKLWNIDDCGLLGELRAHNTQINDIATNEQLIFTASKYVHWSMFSSYQQFSVSSNIYGQIILPAINVNCLEREYNA